MALVWSPRAQHRLREHARHLAEHDYPETAVNWLMRIKSAAERLVEFPESGRESPEFMNQRPKVRDIAIGQFRLFYRRRKGDVEIISVHHCRQSITTLRAL